MGGIIVTAEGETAEEAREKLEDLIAQAKLNSLCLEGQTEPEISPQNGKWRAGAALHT